ncbi:MAG: YfcE family phosphodiesterase [Clostridia bacterium]|nr:YfcE family phosphodiesterase [Clostridia bacterium]
MKRVIAVSDSHGMEARLRKVLTGILQKQPADVVVFLGDGLWDWENIVDDLRQTNPRTHFYRVSGNNDRSFDVPDHITFSLGGVKFFACHGHRYRVKVDLDLLEIQAVSNEAQVALYGHTHIADITNYFNCLFVNPGAISGWGSYSPVAAEVLVHDDRSVTARLITERETE